MIVKRYIGKTTQEAMNKLRVELGSDAIILHTRKIKKGGLFGMFKKSLVEVVAAIDDDTSEESFKPQPKRRNSKSPKVASPKNTNYNVKNYKNHGYNTTPRNGFGSTVRQADEEELKKELLSTISASMNKNTQSSTADRGNRTNTEDTANFARRSSMTPSKEKPPEDKDIDTGFFDKLDVLSTNNKTDKDEEISEEIKRLRGTMEGFMKNFQSNFYKNFNLPEKLRPYKEIMVERGVSEVVANSILGNIDKNIDLGNKSEDEIDQIIKFNISGYLDNPSPIRESNKQKIIFFIGPTGVGKTTTLAKLAAYYTIEKKFNVGLVTADTYRIAAVEQLKTYSNILDIPIEIVYEKEDFNEVLSNFNDKDMIFVDTAGRSHKNQEQIDDLKDLLDMKNSKEVYLVLSTTTNIDNIRAIIKQYEFIENFKIIFTKTDETDDLGVILNTKFYTEHPLSYITTGQNVPEDIEIVDITKLTNKLIGETKQ